MTAPNKNAKPDIWVDAEVYVSTADDPKISMSGEPDENWHLVGLLDGSNGFGNTRAFEDVTANAWGKGQVAKGRRNFTSTGSFSALERNDVTEYLMWPGSTKNVKVVPKPAHVFLAYVATNQEGDTEILITRVKAEVFAPEASRTEEVAGTVFEVTHFVDGKGGVFDEITVSAGEGTTDTIAPVRIKELVDKEQAPLDITGKPVPTGDDSGDEEDPEEASAQSAGLRTLSAPASGSTTTADTSDAETKDTKSSGTTGTKSKS